MVQENGRHFKAPLIMQLNMVHAEAREEGPFIRIHTMREEGELAHLFIVLEADGPYPEETCTRVAQSFIVQFSVGGSSITGRLQEALKRTHEGLLAENYLAAPEDRSTVGIVCAYLQNSDLYLGYAGPAAAQLIGPKNSLSLAPAPGDPKDRLGAADTQQVWARHHRLLPEETLVLSTSPLHEMVEGHLLLASFRQRLEQGMATIYRAAANTSSYAVLAVAPRVQWKEAATAAPSSAPSAPPPPPRTEMEDDEYSPFDTGRVPPWRSVSSRLDARSWEPIPTLDLGIALNPKMPGRYRSRISRSLLKPVALAVAGLFLLGGLATGTQAIREGINQQTLVQAEALIQQSHTLWLRALSAPSKDERRAHLREAAVLLREAVVKTPNAGVARLYQQVEDALAALDAVEPLQDVRLVADAPALLGRNVLLRDPVVQADRLYLLDKLGNQVLQFPLSGAQGGGTATSIASVLPQNGAYQGRLTKLLWLPSGGDWTRNSLLALDESYGLVEVDAPAGPQPLTLRGTQSWTSFQAAAGANGALYILDPKGNQVLRHMPTVDGFDAPARVTARNIDLEDSVDFYIDQHIYFLSREGRVIKLMDGTAQRLSLDGLDKPLTNPIAITSLPSSANLYVLDEGNKRVVVIRKEDGVFLRQHTLGDLPPIHAFWLDQERGRIILIGDRQIYSASFPGA